MNISLFGLTKIEALFNVMKGYGIDTKYVSNVNIVKASLMRQTLEYGNFLEYLDLPVEEQIEDDDGDLVFNPAFEEWYNSLSPEALIKIFDDAPDNCISWATPSKALIKLMSEGIPYIKKTYQIYSAFAGRFIDIEAAEMTEEEYEHIENKKDTPDFVHIIGSDTLLYNDFTCLNGFDGTCQCLSHPRKSWMAWSLKDRDWVD